MNNRTIYFTKYAEDKFHVLNRHDIYFTHEQIEDCIKSPDAVQKIGDYIEARKDNIEIIYKKEVGVIMVLTFYPIK